MKTEWLITDGIAPFFRNCPDKRVNWSKTPFDHVEKSGMLTGERAQELKRDFAALTRETAALGYNAVTLDDLAHLIDWAGHAPAVLESIGAYRRLYRELFALAASCGLRTLITSDVFSLTPPLSRELSAKDSIGPWLAHNLEKLFQDFPEVAGVVFRIGESDAIGTPGDFHSRLLIRTPDQANAFLRALLPVFEKHRRTLFFRTWTVGAYRVGDLMWHRRTFERVFRDLRSDALVVSMKYGESDFFRYLPVNAHFFAGPWKTLVEFQSRREYEGFGEYPSFVGWEYERILRDLAAAPNLVGASVWCQTGGWSKFRRLTYVENSSVWVELNHAVTAFLCQGLSCEQAVRRFCEPRWPQTDVVRFLAFLALADDVIHELLYIREFAARKLFFRRLRVPPLIVPYWDRIAVTHGLRQVLRHLVDNPALCVREGYAALRKLDLMRELAREGNLPDQGLDFQRDTFEILAVLRELIFAEEGKRSHLALRLENLRDAYRRKWKTRYAVKIKCVREPHRSRTPLRLLLRLLLRRQRGYRLLDSLFTLRLLAWLYPRMGRWRRRLAPKFAKKQAMGLDALFK
jgi:hypothetical protein